MVYQWVKVIMKNDKPYYVKIQSPNFIQAIPWVARCLQEQGISSANIEKYSVVKRPGRPPKNRIFYYERPNGMKICESCGKMVPKDTNICIMCGAIFNERLIELNNVGNQKNKKF
jgi:hypothetical protein